MISFHNIFSIAKYERKTLLRSWFFRIFSVLSLLILFGMNFGMVIEGGGEEGWAIRSIPAAIPYFNLLILNVAQAIIAVFLASDFLKRDKKLDTTEVIYMRSMTNGEYVIGKTWGNLQVFLVLNIAVIAMALIFNLLAQGTTVHWASYVIYLLLISVPTLVFIMGLSFMLMSVIRNQAITFVLVLGYIGITLFLLEARYYYIFDYMAFNIPMLISDIAGMGNLDRVLIHRGIYFSLGISFIFLTIYLLKRLPQSESMTVFSLIFAILFFGAGGYLGYRHISEFKTSNNLRNEVIILNNEFVKEKIPSTLAHSIMLKHEGNELSAVSTLTVVNQHSDALNKLILSLNNGLKVHEVKLNGTSVPFSRQHHLIIAGEGITIQPGQQAEIEISYSGAVDETTSYLDITEEERVEKYGRFVLNVDKRHAFLTPDYVLLTPEINWYPKPGVTYSTIDVSWYQPEFIDFNLDVTTRPGLQAVSQGEITEVSPGRFHFSSNVPLTQLSLAIGNYEKKNIQSDSLEYGIWLIKGHDFFSDELTETRDTIDQLVSERLGDFERTYNLEYAFNRLFLVEVPAQFKTYERIWTSSQEYIQPEQILIPEKGYMIREADLDGSRKRMERWGRRGDNNMTDKDIEIRLIYDFLGIFRMRTAGISSEAEETSALRKCLIRISFSRCSIIFRITSSRMNGLLPTVYLKLI
jgi:ABC-type transport system involved in multi-copper enzyme maturation permease subunit